MDNALIILRDNRFFKSPFTCISCLSFPSQERNENFAGFNVVLRILVLLGSTCVPR